jgi:hypothetical protein
MTDIERLLRQEYEAAHELPDMPPSLAGQVRRRRMLRTGAPLLGGGAVAAAVILGVTSLGSHSAARSPAELGTSPQPTPGPSDTQCPASWTSPDGVPAPPQDSRGNDVLVPGQPTALDYCVYAWHSKSQGQAPMSERRSEGEIQGDSLNRFISLANAVPVATPTASPSPESAVGAPHSCPMDDGSFVVMYARYSDQPELMLVQRDTGCRYISNGSRLASETAGSAYTQFDQYAQGLIDTDPAQS